MFFLSINFEEIINKREVRKEESVAIYETGRVLLYSNHILFKVSVLATSFHMLNLKRTRHFYSGQFVQIIIYQLHYNIYNLYMYIYIYVYIFLYA